MTAGVSLVHRHIFCPKTWRMLPVDYTPAERQQVKNTEVAKRKKLREKQRAAVVKSLAPRKSGGFSITPAAGDSESDKRFALRRGTI